MSCFLNLMMFFVISHCFTEYNLLLFSLFHNTCWTLCQFETQEYYVSEVTSIDANLHILLIQIYVNLASTWKLKQRWIFPPSSKKIQFSFSITDPTHLDPLRQKGTFKICNLKLRKVQISNEVRWLSCHKNSFLEFLLEIFDMTLCHPLENKKRPSSLMTQIIAGGFEGNAIKPETLRIIGCYYS